MHHPRPSNVAEPRNIVSVAKLFIIFVNTIDPSASKGDGF